MTAFRVHHDSQRVTEHEQQRQILVYRELPFALIPSE
jgi:hypothetical protein